MSSANPLPAAAAPVVVEIHAPSADAVDLVVLDERGDVELERRPLERRDESTWTTIVDAGTVYGLAVRGGGRDTSKQLLDPAAAVVRFPSSHSRRRAATAGASTFGSAPAAVATPPAVEPAPQRPTSRPLFVYETHVGGLTRRRDRPDAGTFAAAVAELDRLAELGVSVVELLPVHEVDPGEGSYWGYMPLAFGAVAGHYAAGDDAAAELAELVAAAHQRDLELWLDVVFNHTTEVDRNGPTYHLRGLDDHGYYRVDADGAYVETTGCGNDVDVTSATSRRLIIGALDRYADLGVDGFRFDLAPVLVHDAGFVAELDAWAQRRAVRLIAEPWDAAGTHLLGRRWPGSGWLQWNDRFRDDVRSYLRGDEGYVTTLMQRVQGSPDLFDRPLESVNFLACHDGFTLYDVFAYDHKHNEANGHDNTDGSNDNRSSNGGWEGDADVPVEIAASRRRNLRNAWAVLTLSHGTPMTAMGDEFGRTQGGNNNAYNQDNETSWVDWDRAREFAELERVVGALLALRARHPALRDSEWWGERVRFFGVDGEPDVAHHSRSLGWTIGGLCVFSNMWSDELTFELPAGRRWRRALDTADEDTVGVVHTGPASAAGRSVVAYEAVSG